MKRRKITFPKDEGKHSTTGEWWYFNGNLKSSDGREFAYMNTLFRAKVPIVLKRRLEKTPTKNIYFYHSILTDVDNNKFYPHIDLATIVSRDSFKGDLLNIYFSKPYAALNYTSYYMEEYSEFSYRIKGPKIRLNLTSQKAPLLENQTGYVDNLGKSTYYYSLTDLQTEGKILLEDKEISVTGRSWMDHQWADVTVDNDFWNWFSIQLNNGMEIICYEYGRQKESVYLATISYPDSSQKTFHKVRIIPLGEICKGKLTRAEYDLAWRVEIPDEEIDLEIKSKVTDHEMNFLHINYWESPTIITGRVGIRDVDGEGYMELAGRRSIFNDLSFLKGKIKARIMRK